MTSETEPTASELESRSLYHKLMSIIRRFEATLASGLDVLTVSRRLGHGSPVVTLNTYAHLFAKTDTAAAAAIDRVLK